MAHADSVFNTETRHVINVGSDYITGPGIADNAIGMAAVVGLPKLLDRLGIKLKDDLLLSLIPRVWAGLTLKEPGLFGNQTATDSCGNLRRRSRTGPTQLFRTRSSPG